MYSKAFYSNAVPSLSVWAFEMSRHVTLHQVLFLLILTYSPELKKLQKFAPT